MRSRRPSTQLSCFSRVIAERVEREPRLCARLTVLPLRIEVGAGAHLPVCLSNDLWGLKFARDLQDRLGILAHFWHFRRHLESVSYSSISNTRDRSRLWPSWQLNFAFIARAAKAGACLPSIHAGLKRFLRFLQIVFAMHPMQRLPRRTQWRYRELAM
jgi:hypothetical protein